MCAWWWDMLLLMAALVGRRGLLLNWIPEHVRVKAAASRIGWLVPRPARTQAVFFATLLANYLLDAVAAFSCLFSSCISCNFVLCAAALSAAALNRSS